MRKFFLELATNDSDAVMAPFGGIRLDANWNGNVPDLSIGESPGVTGNLITIQGNDGQPGTHYGVAGDFSSTDLTPAGATRGNGTATVVAPGGDVTTVSFGYFNAGVSAGNDCTFWDT